jgi:hypothetical protein
MRDTDERLRRAVMLTLLYADLFDYPLTREEIHRYLIGETASEARLGELLDHDGELQERVQRTDDWFHLVGRADLIQVRRARSKASAQLWPAARRYARAIARLPFVRLVAITGALAMDNAGRRGDIDLFILVSPGRLWICRLLVIALVRLAESAGHTLCPNFLLAADRLTLAQRNIFTAHELVQMRPLERNPWWTALLDANAWARDLLPTAFTAARAAAETPTREPPLTRVAEGLLATPLFDPVERWEMRRKVRRLTARAGREGGTFAFTADECRGHFAAHDVRILAAYAARSSPYEKAVR